MSSTTIDTLNVKISASATDASQALEKLANSLKKVRNALGQTGKDGLNAGTKISRNLTDLHNAINKIDTDGIKKLNQLSSALNRYAAALDKVKGTSAGSGIGRTIQGVKKAVDTPIKNKEVSSSGSAANVDAGAPIKDLEEKISLFKRLGDTLTKAGEKFSALRERIRQFGLTTKQTTNSFNKFLHSIGRIALYRVIRSALKAIGEAFSEGLKNAYLFSKQSTDFTRLAEALDHIKSITGQMTNQLGALWGEIKQFIMPALDWIVERVRWLAEKLTELFAALNGQDTYQFAKLQALEWEEATEEAKKYKQQLLGIDELNNLTTQTNSKKPDTIKDAFEVKTVSDRFKSIGTAWQSLKQRITDAFDGVYGALLEPAAMAVCGALFLFTGHPLLGLGLILAGVTWGVEKLKEDEGLRATLEEKFKQYEDLFTFASVASIAVGTMLLFVPGKRLLGLGLLLGGIAFKEFVKDPLNFSWGGLLKTIKEKFQKYKDMFSKLGKAAVAIGTILLFVPGMRGLGLGLILAGTTVDTLASAKEFSWGGLLKTIKEKFEEYKTIFNVIGAAAVAIGAILLFVPGFRGKGLGLILKGTGVLLLANAEDIQWGELLAKLKETFENIENWWNTTVKPKVTTAVQWLEESWGVDINGDGVIGKGITMKTKQPPANLPEMPSVQIPEVYEYQDIPKYTVPSTLIDMPGEVTITDPQVLEDLDNGSGLSAKGKFVKMIWDSVKEIFSKKEAAGAVNQPGTLFYAGEAGPEFIGAMGNSSAVANTGQMTEAIYKAAYMGMSRALQENGGNGMAGFVPATTDDLFIAMRKKASNYNKVTGNSAFA